MPRQKDDNPIGCVLLICFAFVGLLVFILAVQACNPLSSTPSGPASSQCHWEKEKVKSKGSGFMGYMTRGSGGTSGGGFKAPAPKPAPAPKAPSLTKPGTSTSKNGGTYKPATPRYTKTNPPPRPTTPLPSGYKWELDCD